MVYYIYFDKAAKSYDIRRFAQSPAIGEVIVLRDEKKEFFHARVMEKVWGYKQDVVHMLVERTELNIPATMEAD